MYYVYLWHNFIATYEMYFIFQGIVLSWIWANCVVEDSKITMR